MSDDLSQAATALTAQLESAEATQTGTIEVAAAPEAPPKAAEPVAAEQTEQEKRFARNFAALSRKEKEVKAKEKVMQDREAQLEARIKELEARSAPVAEVKKSFQERAKENVFKALDEEGYSFETLTRAALNDGQLPPEVQMKFMRQELEQNFQAQLAALKAEMASKEEAATKAAQERAQKGQEEEQNRAVTLFKQQIGELVAAKVEDFSLVAAEGEYGVQAVFDLIAQDAQKKREELGEEAEIELLSTEEAVKQVEDRLLNKAKEYIKLQKIQGLFGTPAPTKNQSPTDTKPQNPAAKTLSNVNSQVQGPTKRHMSDEDRLREAARNLKFLAD